MSIDISFVIPFSYREDRSGRLNRILHHLEDLRTGDDEIIISDESPFIPTNELEDAPFDVYINDWRAVFNRARALNLGIKLARNRFICTTDIDIVYTLDFFPKIKPLVEENSLLTFNVEENGRIIHKGIPGFSIIFDKQKCEEIGMWDESFEGYGEEDNIFRDHYILAGGKLKYVPISIEHLPHPQSELCHEYVDKAHQHYLVKKHELEEKYGVRYDPWTFNPR